MPVIFELESLRPIARRYAKKCRWMDEEELFNEAVVAALTVLPNLDIERGNIKHYINRTVKNALRMYLWQNTGPTGAPKRGGSASKVVGSVTHEYDGLFERDDDGHRRALKPYELERLATTPCTDEALQQDKAKTAVRIALQYVQIDASELALPVLLGDSTMKEVASMCGISVRVVREAVTDVRTAVERSKQCRVVAAELEQ